MCITLSTTMIDHGPRPPLYFTSTGEVPDGCEAVVAHENFYVKGE